MNTTFADFLTEQKPDADTIQQAARLYLGERTDDLAPKEMLAELSRNAPPKLVEQARKELEQEADTVESILLTLLANAWEDAPEQERIRRAFASARKKMPLIEIVAITTITLYAMYLIARLADPEIGKKKETERIERGADGSYKQERTTEWHPQTSPISGVSGLFKVLTGGDDH